MRELGETTMNPSEPAGKATILRVGIVAKTIGDEK
jgi:hypothetical protein